MAPDAVLPATFTPNSLTHALTVVGCLLAIAGFVGLGRTAARHSEAREWRVRVVWVWFVVVFQAFAQVWQNVAGRRDVLVTLPLHVCDLAPWLGALALLTTNPWARSLAWFWGIGLSIWAFILPALDSGPASLTFWVFWIGHVQIIATAAYLVWVQHYRPSWADLRRAAVALAAYTAVLVPVDLWLEADYGYLGRESFAAPLGPWPLRVGVLFVAELLLFVVVLLPWVLARRLGRAGADGGE